MNKTIAAFIKSMKQYDSNQEKKELYDKIQALADDKKLSTEDSKEIVTSIFQGETLASNIDEKLANYLGKDVKIIPSDYDDYIPEDNDDTQSTSNNETTDKGSQSKVSKDVVNGLAEILSRTGNGIKLDKRKKYIYKVVEAPGMITTGSTKDILMEYENLLNENTRNGWMYYNTQSVIQEIIRKKGCKFNIFEPTPPPLHITVILLIFVKEVNE